jgi:hypothetical protein
MQLTLDATVMITTVRLLNASPKLTHRTILHGRVNQSKQLLFRDWLCETKWGWPRSIAPLQEAVPYITLEASGDEVNEQH